MYEVLAFYVVSANGVIYRVSWLNWKVSFMPILNDIIKMSNE